MARVLISLLVLLLVHCFPAVQAQTMTRKIKDIEYAQVAGKTLTLDLYLPRNKTAPALVVWVPAGAWQFASKEKVWTSLVDYGFALASIDFRQSPGARFPAPVHQSLELADAYRKLGLDVELHLVPGAGHMDQVYFSPEYTEIVARFLSRVLN